VPKDIQEGSAELQILPGYVFYFLTAHQFSLSFAEEQAGG
jgi:hypothetical protein